MINIAARQKLMEDRKTKTLVAGMQAAVVTAVKSMAEPKTDDISKLKESLDNKIEDNNKKLSTLLEGFKETLNQKIATSQEVGNVAKMPLGDVLERLVQEDGERKYLEKLITIDTASTKSASLLEKIGNAFVIINNSIKGIKFDLPKVFQVKGQVEVIKTPPVRITNLDEMGQYFKSLEGMLKTWAQAAAMAPQPKIEIPKIEIPESKIDLSGIREAIGELRDSLSKKSTDDSIAVLRRINEGITNLVNRPVMTPLPPTNVSINGLQGFAKTTTTTVTTTLTELPGYGELNNRRTLIFFNNSAATTVYVGGSDVTSANGLPVLAQSYSPAIDAGVYMKIYGVTASGSADVRTLEVSSNQTASKVQ